MNVPSLQRLAVLSFVFHVTFFGVALLLLKQSARFVMPSPYVVNLVESDVKSEEPAGTQAVSQAPAPEAPKAIQKKEVSKEEALSPSPKESKKLTLKERKRLQESIAALKAKKNIERIVKLRNELRRDIIPLKGSASGGKTGALRATAGKNVGAAVSDYYTKVTRRIWDRWGLPQDLKEKNLEAVVSIRIMKDGSVEINGIEKSSGSSLFDHSALLAIREASPLPPPPYEMEIGVRFYP